MITILILATVIIMAVGSSTLLFLGIRTNRNQEYSAGAYFAAETGAERALWENRKNGFEFRRQDGSICVSASSTPANPDCIVFTAGGVPAYCAPCADNATVNTIVNATYQVRFEDYEDATEYVTLLSIGQRAGIVRSVEVKYKY